MIKQDFTKRMTIVVDKVVRDWKLLNTVGHIAAYLGNKMDEGFTTGDYFETKDGVKYKRNCQYPIIVLSATQNKLKKLLKKVKNSNLLYIVYIPEMVEYTDDERLMEKVSKKQDKDLEYLGVGLFGGNEKIKELTREFGLWK